MIDALARRPFFVAMVAYLGAATILAMIAAARENMETRRAINARVAAFRRELDDTARAPYLAIVRETAIAQEPENARHA